MPNLDVTEVLVDADFADTCWVKRRHQTISNTGRVEAEPEKIFKDVVGVFTSAGPNDLERLDDSQRMGRVMCFITKFPLRGPSPGFLPDQIVWTGDTYVVLQIDPYTRYGQGFIQAIIGSQNSQDRAAPMKGQENFSDPSNSNLI